MAVPGIETSEPKLPTIGDRIIEAARHAAEWSCSARTWKSVARDLEDFQEEAVHYVRRQPVKAIGIAAGIGLAGGVAAGWLAGRLGQRRPPEAGHDVP